MHTLLPRTCLRLASAALAGGLLASLSVSAQTPVLHYGLNEASGNYASTGSASVDLLLSGANQQHGAPGSGVSGLLHDRAWDASANTAQGATPSATNNSRLIHGADFDGIDGLAAFTFTFWYKLDQHLDSGTRFLSNADTNATQGFLLRSVTNTSGTLLELRLGNGDPTTSVINSNRFATDTGYRRINTWVFVGITWDGSTVRFFVADKETAVADAGSQTYNVGPLANDTQPLIFGNRASSNGVDGFLDNLRIYTTALTDVQLEQIRNEDLTPAPIITGGITGPSVVNVGDTLVLVADTTGSSPVTFRWYLGDELISGQTTATLTIDPASMADIGLYRYEADDAGGNLVSRASWYVNVIPPLQKLLAYGFNEPSGNYASVGSVHADLIPGGDFQRAGDPGSGVSGLAWDRAWDATANTIQSHLDTGEVNNSRIEHAADRDEVDDLAAFSISMWYWADEPMRSAANRLYYNANSNSPSTGLVLRWSTSGSNSGWELFAGPTGASNVSYPSTKHPVGTGYNRTKEWVYLAIAWDGATLRYFVGDKNTPVAEAGSAAMANLIGNDPSRLVIGNTTSNNRGFDGKLDNFRLYSGSPLDAAGFEALRQADLAPVANVIAGERILNAGDRLELTADTSGSAPVAFAWFRNDQLIAGQTSATLVIAAATADDAGAYRYEAYDASSQLVSQSNAAVTIRPTIGPRSLLLGYGFNEATGIYSSIGELDAEMIAAGDHQGPGAPGSGVSGLAWDRAWDASANTIQSHDSNNTSLVNNSRLAHVRDLDAIDNLGAFTLAFWYWADQPMVGNANRLVYNANSSTAPTAGMTLRWATDLADNTKAGWELRTGPDSVNYFSNTFASGEGFNRAQQWIFTALAWDGTTLTYYHGDTQTPVAPAGSVPFSPILGNDPAALTLGNVGGSHNRGFDGKLDNFRLYSGPPLSQEELESLRQTDLAPVANIVDGNAHVAEGGALALSANTSGLATAPASYRWFRNGVLLSGATGSTFAIGSTGLAASGVYSFEALDGLGTVVASGRLRVSIDSSVPIGLTPRIVQEPAGNVLVFLPYVAGASGWCLQATDEIGLPWTDVASSADGVTWTALAGSLAVYGDSLSLLVTVIDSRSAPAAGRRFWRLVAEVPGVH